MTIMSTRVQVSDVRISSNRHGTEVTITVRTQMGPGDEDTPLGVVPQDVCDALRRWLGEKAQA